MREIINTVKYREDEPSVLERHERGIIIDGKFTGVVDFLSKTFGGTEFMDVDFFIDGESLIGALDADGDEYDCDADREFDIERRIEAETGLAFSDVESKYFSIPAGFAYEWAERESYPSSMMAYRIESNPSKLQAFGLEYAYSDIF